MAEELITYLPPDIIVNILSRLPIRTVTTSKCVCKPWLDLIETPEFAKSHLSKSVPGVIVGQCQTGEISYTTFTILDFEEAIKEEELEPHQHRYSKIAEIKFLVNPRPSLSIEGSANGLLLFQLWNTQSYDLYICNPILRHSIQLPNPGRTLKYHPIAEIYGFGVSKIKDEYKVVRIVVQREHSECEVYTLGTRTWRTVACCVSFTINCVSMGTLHNGKLHWLTPDLNRCLTMITSFDLETETFSTFSPSPPESKRYVGDPHVFDDCLCLCNYSCYDEIDIWMMKNECWRKQFRISKHPDLVGPSLPSAYPVMLLRDGGVLMLWAARHLFYYSGKNRTTKVLNMFEQDDGYIVAMPHTSSFVSLKRFIMENVSSF